MKEYIEKNVFDYKVKLKPLALSEWNIRASSLNKHVLLSMNTYSTSACELAKNKFGEASRWILQINMMLEMIRVFLI